jgi:hypothetical protein
MDDRDGLFSAMASCGQGIVRRETRKHGHHVGCDIELFPGEFILFCCVYAFHDFSGDVTSPSAWAISGSRAAMARKRRITTRSVRPESDKNAYQSFQRHLRFGFMES